MTRGIGDAVHFALVDYFWRTHTYRGPSNIVFGVYDWWTNDETGEWKLMPREL